jgi:hypothetical protein
MAADQVPGRLFRHDEGDEEEVEIESSRRSPSISALTRAVMMSSRGLDFWPASVSHRA